MSRQEERLGWAWQVVAMEGVATVAKEVQRALSGKGVVNAVNMTQGTANSHVGLYATSSFATVCIYAISICGTVLL